MSQEPTSQHQDTNSTTPFADQTNPPQSNPFSGDLKGEFSNDFGTNTNAVSQIFKSSGFASGDRTKNFVIGGVILALIGLAAYFILGTGDEQADDPFASQEEVGEGRDTFGEDESEDIGEEDGYDGISNENLVNENVAGDTGNDTGSYDAPDEFASEEGASPSSSAREQEGARRADKANDYGSSSQSQAASRTSQSTGSFSVVEPGDGAEQGYDETKGPAVFRWEGEADRIYFSRSSTMRPIHSRIRLNGKSSFAFNNPSPGTWYWQVENSSGRSEVRRFQIQAPARRQFPITQPQPGSAIAGTGGIVAWQLGEKIARYKVQLVQQGSSWGVPQHVFATSGNSIALQGVAPGSYRLRVGAFSEVAGRWEWQEIDGGVMVQ